MYNFRASFYWTLLCTSVVVARALTNATDPCAPPDLVYVTNQSDADLIAGCVILKTGLEISTNSSLSLPNLVTIEGHVTINELNSHDPAKILDRQLQEDGQTLVSLSFPRLETIQGFLSSRSTTLKSLELPMLSSVRTINLEVPNLTTWTGTDTLRRVDELWFVSHKISSLEFRNLENISSLRLSGSGLSEIYLNGTMEDPGYGATVSINSINGDVSLTSDLRNTQNITFIISGCRNITVNAASIGILQISDNPKLKRLNVPALTHVSNATNYFVAPKGSSMIAKDSGRIVIMDNEFLQVIEFPNLVSVDEDLKVLRNPLLKRFGDGFPSLETVGGSFEVDGNLSSFQFPSPVHIGRTARIISSIDTFNCTSVKENFPNGTNIWCSPEDLTMQKAEPTPTHKDKLTYSGKIGLGVGLAVFVVLTIGLGCGFCLWRSHRHPDESGRAANISSKLLRLWAKESFQKKPPSYQLQDFNGRDEPLPSYQPRPSSTATTLAPERDEEDVSRPGTGSRVPRGINGVATEDERSVALLSAGSVSRPSPTNQSAPTTLPPGYRP